ncbi:SDR family oxidoreductase [Streptomyces sp. NPDC058620]|uniref:SDR family oxidoreductase n=1 Tax=Streptomyces sp. NPDC058620 TaxID=3346560 RepID=UPI00366801A4
MAEGLFFCLPAVAVRGLLGVIAELSAPGSVLAGDFISATALTNPYARPFLKNLSDDGSPWQFGTHDPHEFLREAGWQPLDLRQPGEQGAGFGRCPYPVPPATIIRSGRIGGNGVTGACPHSDGICALVRAGLLIGYLPDAPVRVDLTPVDFAAAAVLALQDTAGHRTHHLLSPAPATMNPARTGIG